MGRPRTASAPLALPRAGARARTALVGALLLALLSGVAAVLFQAQADSRQAAERRFAERAEVSATLTQSVFSALGTSSGDDLEQRFGGPRAIAARELRRQVARSQGGYLTLVDESGRRVAAAGRPPRRPALTRALSGGPTLSDVVQIRGTRFVEYAIPFGPREQRRALIQGVPLAILTQFLDGYLERLSSVQGAGLELTDARGIVLTRQGQVSPPRATAEGRISATAAVPGTTWTLRIEGDRDRVLMVANNKRWLPWALLAALALAALAGLLLHARVVLSVRRQREANSALQESRDQIRNLVDALEEAVVLHHADGRTELLNASARALVDSEADALDGLAPGWELLGEDGKALDRADTPIQRTLCSGLPQRQIVGLRHPSGSRRWLAVSARPLVRPGERRPHAVVASCSDVTEQRETEEQLIDLAQRDPLTGLWNRRRFEEDLARQLARCRRYGETAALLLLDVDGFKDVNDSLGHLAGDDVLRALADGLRQRVRASDGAARIGGDEFAVLLPNLDEEQARAMTTDLADRLMEFAGVQASGRNALSISVGVALLDGETGGLTEAFAAADRAMYEDKARNDQTRAVAEESSRRVSGSLQELLPEPTGEEPNRASLRALLTAVHARDSYTAGHSRQVVTLARAVANRLRLDEGDVREIETAALLHDIGKIAVPDAILRKRGSLSAQEELLMRQHPVVGAQMVCSIPELEHLAPAIRAEHERWDGAGYPDGLAGSEIPLASRITFVCDAYHAMTSDRPYRRALSPEEAMGEIAAQAGRQFCPVAAAELLALLREEHQTADVA